jgi:hypothetical protein
LEGWAAEQGAREALDQAKLEQVQREHCNFLIFTAIGREISAFAVMDYDLNGAASVVRNRSAIAKVIAKSSNPIGPWVPGATADNEIRSPAAAPVRARLKLAVTGAALPKLTIALKA